MKGDSTGSLVECQKALKSLQARYDAANKWYHEHLNSKGFYDQAIWGDPFDSNIEGGGQIGCG